MGSEACIELLKKPLVFALNGGKVELADADPSMTLLTYLRTETEYKGTKLGCGEGGCGACVVLLSKYDTRTKKVEEVTINSCLALLSSVDRCAVTTIEGIGNSRDGLHAVQKRFGGFHASQCGFCTPGMCMSIYGALRQHQNNGHHDGVLKGVDIEKSIAGNICRCTGYRPIIDVCKSFAGDTDLEDLGLNSYWMDKKLAHVNLLPKYDPNDDPKFPDFLIKELEELGNGKELASQVYSSTDGQSLIRPKSLQGVFSLLEQYHEAKVVVGHTSAGIYKDSDPRVLIDIGHIPELLIINQSEDGIEVGAAIKIEQLIALLENGNNSKHGKTVLGGLSNHLKMLATKHVRNAGSIGGNLVMAQTLGFDSDLATILLGVGASVKLTSPKKDDEVKSMDEFLESTLEFSTILKTVFIPSYQREYGLIKFETYRASPRSLGNSVAYANAAFLVCLEKNSIKESKLAFGAFGHKHAIRAKEVEKFLKGKCIDAVVTLEALRLLRTVIVPKTGTAKRSYRSALAVSFLFKFLNSFISPPEVPSSIIQIHKGKESLITGTQLIEDNNKHALGKPSSKVMVDLQSSGEAIYVDDIPSPHNCLHGALVCSEQAFAKIKEVQLKDAFDSVSGFVSFVTGGDIPPNGRNVGCVSGLVTQDLFGIEKVYYVGQPIGIVVADTLQHAKAAAKKVRVQYETELMEPPIITIEDAVARNSFVELKPYFRNMIKPTYGNLSEGFAQAEHIIENGEVSTASQYFFYMETNTALAIPDEDNCIVVYSSCQSTESVQATVAACLAIPMHNVRVITRRVGGGFGGKAVKACAVAAACALAAFKLKRPVRLSLDRTTDMILAGGRSATKTIYKAGFMSDGRITALQAKVFIHGGWSEDMSSLLPLGLTPAMQKFNWGSYEFEFGICKTNLPSRTSMRGPGDTQGSFIADTVIEHVAALLKLDSHKVMERNLHSLESSISYYSDLVIGGKDGYTLPLIWENIKQKSGYEKRLKLIEEYNSNNLWFKKGLGISFCTYKVTQQLKTGRVSILSDSSIVVEVAGIEIGQGLWTKVRQTVAFALSHLWEDGGGFVDISKIRVVQADSISVPNGGWTGGSTTSESSCEAVRLVCNILVERLKPVKQKLDSVNSDSNVTTAWESIISAAAGVVALSAQSEYSASPEAIQYLNYGAAVSEVEIDVLTGETKILQTDLIYDCGKSMNPAVDIGQIEGAFVQGIGFFMTEEYLVDDKGRLVSNGTWTYKPPTVDNIPRIFNIELLNSPAHKHRILSSKASGEPPLLLASSVHGAIRHAIAAARNDASYFRLDAPATIDQVRTLCGLENFEHHISAP